MSVEQRHFLRFNLGIPVSFEALLEVGRRAAQHAGVTTEGIEDCAVEFVERHSNWIEKRIGEPDGCQSLALMRVCARHHACNYRVREERIARDETPYPTVMDEDGICWFWEPVDERADPEALVMLKVFWREVMAAAAGLNARQRGLLQRYYVDGASEEQLVEEFSLTPEALRKALDRAHRRLGSLLLKRGVTELEMRAETARLSEK